MKKKLTVQQQKNKYARTQIGCLIGEYLSVFAPFIAVGIAKWNEYFVETEAGVKMSLAMILSLGVMGIAIWAITEKKLENTYASLIIKWAVISLIITLMGQLVTDLATIMWVGLIGLVSAAGFDLGSKKAKAKKEIIIADIKKAESDQRVEQVKEENKQ